MQFRRRLAPISVLNLVPMVDVVFNLVVFFMVTSTFIVAPAIKLKLPASTTAENAKMSPLVVSVQSADALYVNRTRYNLAGFDRALSALGAPERRAIHSVVLEGDENITYSLMVQVLDILRKNGFEGISLRMEPVPRSAPEASRP